MHAEQLDDVLRYLVRLLQQPVTVNGEAVPGWWTSDSPSARPDAAWPTGHGNFGMAHGVAGPSRSSPCPAPPCRPEDEHGEKQPQRVGGRPEDRPT